MGLGGSRFFSSIDLVQGYLQCAMKEEDIPKTAFNPGTGGHYEFTRMPFGLSNSGATFSRLMQACLGDENYKTLLIYLDDVLVFSNDFASHLVQLQLVFNQLRQHGLKIKPSKCSFFQTSVRYLGHVISEEGVSTDPTKVTAVTSWKIPETEKELRSFLGLTSYYRRYIKGFSAIAKPLNNLLGGTRKKLQNKLHLLHLLSNDGTVIVHMLSKN